MVGEGFGAIDGWNITLLLAEMVIVTIIPGFLLSLAIFPKRDAMLISERMALSFGLGLTCPALLMLLNMGVGILVNFITILLTFLFVSIVGFLFYMYRGGNPNLLEWYRTEK